MGIGGVYVICIWSLQQMDVAKFRIIAGYL